MRGQIKDPRGNVIEYQGSPQNRQPALIYFALSGTDSLDLAPYNDPVLPFRDTSIRVFSITIPGHENGMDKLDAIQYWADQMQQGNALLENFFDETLFSIQWLIDEGWIDEKKLAVAGLSRGGFIAAHIAARDKRIQTLLGFAPVVSLKDLKEFKDADFELHRHAETLDLLHQTDQLIHLHNFRFYIGNRDLRVNTDSCYNFIRKMADAAHEARMRQCKIELFITPSIGYKGHGTAPHIFQEGAEWAKKHLIRV